MNSLYEKLLFETVRRGENSIVDNFGAFNWRPDSETVASRAFARASVIFEFRGGYFVNST